MLLLVTSCLAGAVQLCWSESQLTKKNDGVSEGKTRIKKKIQQSLTYALKEKSKARTKKDKWLMKECIRSSETDQPQVTLTMNCKNNKILI